MSLKVHVHKATDTQLHLIRKRSRGANKINKVDITLFILFTDAWLELKILTAASLLKPLQL